MIDQEIIIPLLIRSGFCVTPCPAGIKIGDEVVMVGSRYCSKCKYFRGGEISLEAPGYGSGNIKCEWRRNDGRA
jgi:Fe-S oxidoreductase